MVDWKGYIKHCKTKLHYSHSTIDDRCRKLRHIIRHGFNIDNVEGCYDFLAWKVDRNTPNTGINHYIKALNSYHSFIKSGHHFDLYREYVKPVKIPTVDEIRKIIKSFSRSNIEKTVKTMTFLLANTGFRNSELCSIRLDDIDWNRCSITVTGKGRKTRVVPVKEHVLKGGKHPSVLNYVKHHRDKNTDSNYLFVYNNKKFTSVMYRRYFKQHARKIGSSWMHPHSLRHFYATQLLKKGVNIKIVQIVLGHSNVKTTSRYLHMLDNDIFSAINNIDMDDLVFSLTGFIDRNFYGPAENYNFFSLDRCQGGGFFV